MAFRLLPKGRTRTHPRRSNIVPTSLKVMHARPWNHRQRSPGTSKNPEQSKMLSLLTTFRKHKIPPTHRLRMLTGNGQILQKFMSTTHTRSTKEMCPMPMARSTVETMTRRFKRCGSLCSLAKNLTGISLNCDQTYSCSTKSMMSRIYS